MFAPGFREPGNSLKVHPEFQVKGQSQTNLLQWTQIYGFGMWQGKGCTSAECPQWWSSVPTGKRICLGEGIARMELFLFFTTILQNFSVASPMAPEDIDLTPQEIGVGKLPPVYQISFLSRGGCWGKGGQRIPGSWNMSTTSENSCLPLSGSSCHWKTHFQPVSFPSLIAASLGNSSLPSHLTPSFCSSCKDSWGCVSFLCQ